MTLRDVPVYGPHEFVFGSRHRGGIDICGVCEEEKKDCIRKYKPVDVYPTIRSTYNKVAEYIKGDEERELLDLGFRMAFQMHPDYWDEYEIRLVPVTDPTKKGDRRGEHR